MHRRFPYLRGLREELQYRLENVLARGAPAQFLVLVVLSLGVIVFGMSALFFGLFGPENAMVEGIRKHADDGFWGALWWSMSHVLSRGAFVKDYGATAPVVIIALSVSIMGMIIFGMLIGFISASFESRLASLRKGNSAVKESGHILILGWSDKVIAILTALASYRRNLRAVILAPRGVESMQERLRAEEIPGHRIRVILRSGSPNTLAELRRVAFAKTSSIIILSGERGGRRDDDQDVEAIKTLMLLSAFKDWPYAKPILVSEISRTHNLEIADIASRRSVPIVSSNNIIAKVIVQACRYRGLSAVYAEIFSFHGNAIHIQHFPECVDKRFGEIACSFPGSIPIGISWTQEDQGILRNAAGLDPEPDYTIADDEQLVFLSVVRPSYHAPDIPLPPPAEVTPSRPTSPGSALRRILILGWNDKLYDILTELNGHASPGLEVEVVSGYPQHQASQRLARRTAQLSLDKLSVRCVNGDTTSRATLQQLDATHYDCIITLADESSGDIEPDARTIITLLLLTDMQRDRPAGQRTHIVTEILDGRTRTLIAGTAVDDVIISPEIVSMQLAQISQQPVLNVIYRELLSAGGLEICLKPAERYAPLHQSCAFSDLIVAAQGRIEVALGVHIARFARDPRRHWGMFLNPSKHSRWELTAEDSIIVLAQEIYGG